MAPQFTDGDFQVLISCIKNSSVKLAPNFEQVAKECGLKDSKAAYMKHWSMMRKLGLTGSKAQSRVSTRTNAVTPKKRVAAADNDGGNGGSDGESVEPETPTKRIKKE